jgi:hypothetical protein
MQEKRANVMKKNAKIRLTLSRETLRSLTADEAPNAQGGVVLLTNTCYQCLTYTCPTHCGQTYCYYV